MIVSSVDVFESCLWFGGGIIISKATQSLKSKLKSLKVFVNISGQAYI